MYSVPTEPLTEKSPYVKLMNTTENMVEIPTYFLLKLQPIENFEIFHTSTPLSSNLDREQALLNELNVKGLYPKVKVKLEKLCIKFNDLFSLKNDALTVNSFYKQKIHLNDRNPIFIKTIQNTGITEARNG